MICGMEGTLSDLQSQVLVSQLGRKKVFCLASKNSERVAMYVEHPNTIFYAISYSIKWFCSVHDAHRTHLDFFCNKLHFAIRMILQKMVIHLRILKHLLV